MDNQQAYNAWSETYDAVENKTRDLEARALRRSVAGAGLDILEIGCGTGKNTEFLRTKAARLVAVDFSPQMLGKARAKFASAATIEFRPLDLREKWNFAADSFDLIVCSLALEHIENLRFIFAEAAEVLRAGGRFYVGELHPFKQYAGSKARFETGAGVFELECFTHHVADFFAAARASGFDLIDLQEWFDDDDGGREKIPRLLTMIFEIEK